MPAECRPRRRPLSPPSPTLLTLLAALAVRPAASAPTPTPTPTPTPPLPFLCPSLFPRTTPASVGSLCPQSPSHTWSWPSHDLQSTSSPRTKILPDRYVKGSDGLWRKVNEYTLYGSTVCESCRGSTDAVVGNDDTITPLGSSARPTVDITDSLPAGWTPTTYVKHTSLTLIISLVLAISICIFIIGCLFLRRARHRRKVGNGDLELKVRNKRRRTSSDDDSIETMVAKEKEHKSTQALWARATARWKANARYTARQRRGKRGIVIRASQQVNPSSVSGDQLDESASLETAVQQGQEDGQLPSAEVEAPSPERVPSPESPDPVLPPAYQCRSSDASLDAIGTCPTPSSNQPLPLYHHAAHLATDDKAVLAQMVDLVSAPPTDGPVASGMSAPAWPDEGEEFVYSDTEPIASSSFIPAPPSKAKMALNYLDHHYLYDDVGPDLGPPAPPFEEAFDLPLPSEIPSAPPALFDSELDASAPSWEDDSPDEADISSFGDSSDIAGRPHEPIDINGRPPGYYQPQ